MQLMAKTPFVFYAQLLSTIILAGTGCCGKHVSFLNGRESRLFRATSDGDLKSVSSLLAEGANVNAREGECETPLMYAAANGRTKMVLFLLERGAAINAISDNGETALVRARGYTETVRALLEKGADIELGAPLISASYSGQLDTVRVLLEKGANPNAELLYGDTALTAVAIQSASMEIAKELIAAGADVEHKKQGKTAEMLAAEYGHQDLAEFLKKAAKKK
jgi:ankyrin repeat protein